jgi:hypothetical protein
LWRVVLDPVPEPFVLAPGARQNGDEPASLPVDVTHRVAGAQFRVGHVEELPPAQHLHQRVPGRDVGRVVAGVAVGEPVGHRHRPVGRYGQDPHQLLQVGPVVLRVAEGHRWRGFAPTRRAVRGLVLAVHGHRGGVVVHLRGVHAELADHADDQVGEQAGPVRVEQRHQRPPDPVVVEPPGVPTRQAEQPRRVGGSPFSQPVQRCPTDQQVDHQQPDRRRRGQLEPAVRLRQPPLQCRVQADPVQEVVDHRQRPQPVTDQPERAILRRVQPPPPHQVI